MSRLGAALIGAGDGLRRIDTGEWQGDAADSFRRVFEPVPPQWTGTGEAFLQAADALAEYADVLERARDDAATAVQEWAAESRQPRLVDVPAGSAAARPAPGRPDRGLRGRRPRRGPRGARPRSRPAGAVGGPAARGLPRRPRRWGMVRARRDRPVPLAGQPDPLPRRARCRGPGVGGPRHRSRACRHAPRGDRRGGAQPARGGHQPHPLGGRGAHRRGTLRPRRCRCCRTDRTRHPRGWGAAGRRTGDGGDQAPTPRALQRPDRRGARSERGRPDRAPGECEEDEGADPRARHSPRRSTRCTARWRKAGRSCRRGRPPTVVLLEDGTYMT